MKNDIYRQTLKSVKSYPIYESAMRAVIQRKRHEDNLAEKRRQEEQLWSKTNKSSLSSLSQFITKYPKGLRINDAKKAYLPLKERADNAKKAQANFERHVRKFAESYANLIRNYDGADVVCKLIGTIVGIVLTIAIMRSYGSSFMLLLGCIVLIIVPLGILGSLFYIKIKPFFIQKEISSARKYIIGFNMKTYSVGIFQKSTIDKMIIVHSHAINTNALIYKGENDIVIDGHSDRLGFAIVKKVEEGKKTVLFPLSLIKTDR